MILLYVAIGVMLLGALYICFSRDLFRVSIAFFLETCALGVILLSRNYDFLAAFLILSSILSAVLLISFGKVINGELRRLDEGDAGLYSKIVGPIIGIFVAVVLCRELLEIYEIKFVRSGVAPATDVNPDIFKLGQAMSGDHAIAFLCFVSIALVLSLGLTLLLRSSANGGSENG